MSIEFVKSSEIAAFYLKHEAVMANCNDCPVNESFALPSNEYDFAILNDLAAAHSVGNKCFIVVSWGNLFEIQRLPDGVNRALLLKYLAKTKKVNIDTSELFKTFLKMLNKCLSSDFETLAKFDNGLMLQHFQADLITKAIIQRRLSSVAVFRKYPEGSANALKAVIAEALEKVL